MNYEVEILLPCPVCGEDTTIDLASIGAGEEGVIIDCGVCCNPLRLRGVNDPSGHLYLHHDG